MITGYEPLPAHLRKYVDYINNTTLQPLPTEHFDDDHAPAGPMVRAQLSRKAWIVYDEHGGIWLRPDLVKKKEKQG